MIRNKYSSILIALSMLLVVSVGTVIGTEQHATTHPIVTESPLFQKQTDRFTETAGKTASTIFLGKDTPSYPFGFTHRSIRTDVDMILILLEKHPQILSKILPLLCNHEGIKPILKENNIEISDITQQITIFQQNPILFKDIIDTQLPKSSLPNPSTLGLNSSNPLAIMIVLIALLPVLVTLVLIIATATIITCFNIGGCFETIFNGIVFGFINGLKPA